MKTAVLFETFVRVKYARQVFDAIKVAKPEKLYFYSNKGRADHPGEIECNNEIRSWINEVDWPCQLHTFFRDECVDVYTSLRGAIDWVFENEGQAIILEDDCVPTPAFFEFCDRFLEKYKEEKRIGFISSCNYLKGYHPQGRDHIFTRYIQMYAWATWRDRWQSQNLNIYQEDYKKYVREYTPNKLRQREGIICFTENKDFVMKTQCWDYIFCLNCFKKQQLGVIPIYRLAKNVGVVGTHQKGVLPAHVLGDLYTGNDYPYCDDNFEIMADEYYDDRVFDLLNPRCHTLLQLYIRQFKSLVKRLIWRKK